MPGESGAQLLQAGVVSAFQDLADDAPVAVVLFVFDANGFAEHHLRQMALRGIAVRLGLLRRVDAGEPDAVLRMQAIEHRDRVAVADADDAAFDGMRSGGGAKCGRRENFPGSAKQLAGDGPACRIDNGLRWRADADCLIISQCNGSLAPRRLANAEE